MKGKARIFLYIIGVLVLLFSTGCIVGRYYEGPEILAEKIKDIKPGITTKEEIIEWFGPPQNYMSPTVFNKILRDLDVTGEPLGTWSLFIDHPRRGTAEVIQDARVLVLDRDDFYEVLAEQVEVTRSMVQDLVGRLLELAGLTEERTE